ncbi:MAG: enoyl-CoA hydratase-related protein [Pseudomonadota bacterium]
MTDESYETLLIDREGPVARLTMNRPERLNAFDPVMRVEIRDAVARLNLDPELRVIILAGAGRAFSAGADLAAKEANQGGPGLSTEQMLKTDYKPAIVGIMESPKLWIAQVTGPAAGVGSAYMLACDLVVMAKSAYLYQAFAAISLIPDGGATWQLLRALGRKRAMEIIIGGERVYGDRCLELGLCNRVVEDGAEADAAMTWAHELSKKAPLAVEYSKKAVYMAAQTDFAEMVSQEAAMQRLCVESDDYREGRKAFFEKREPQFKGS